MREILFRAKKCTGGEWVEGSLLVDKTMVDPKKWDADIIGKNERHATERFYIIPETVGQYTGLTDKNGNKIFEGDILASLPGRAHIVKFEDGGFILTGTAISMRYANRFEVIGNIHDNPELLKGGDDNG